MVGPVRSIVYVLYVEHMDEFIHIHVLYMGHIHTIYGRYMEHNWTFMGKYSEHKFIWHLILHFPMGELIMQKSVLLYLYSAP